MFARRKLSPLQSPGSTYNTVQTQMWTHLWLPTAFSVHSQTPGKDSRQVYSFFPEYHQVCINVCVHVGCINVCTCMLAKEVCGASLILSLSFCCAALSAARSLPGALLSATGLSDELDSASERRQSELLGLQTHTQLWAHKFSLKRCRKSTELQSDGCIA